MKFPVVILSDDDFPFLFLYYIIHIFVLGVHTKKDVECTCILISLTLNQISRQSLRFIKKKECCILL